jgi:hypothetical protein
MGPCKEEELRMDHKDWVAVEIHKEGDSQQLHKDSFRMEAS